MRRSVVLPLALLLLRALAPAQTCPKVAYTNTASTIKELVAAVNCLSSTTEQAVTPKAAAAKSMQAESFQIVGHSTAVRIPTS